MRVIYNYAWHFVNRIYDIFYMEFQLAVPGTG